MFAEGPNPGGLGPPLPFPESNSVFSPCNNPELRSTACASVAFPWNPESGEVPAMPERVSPIWSESRGMGSSGKPERVSPIWCTLCRARFWVTNQFGIVVGFQFGFELVSVRILLPATWSKYSYLTVGRVGGFLKSILCYCFVTSWVKSFWTSIKTPIITVWIKRQEQQFLLPFLLK